MAIVTFHSSHKPLRGKVGGLVFKHYADKVVVTRAPTFSGEWSTAQQDGRKRFALASAYARTACADPVLRAKYEKIAARRGLTIRSVAISAYLKRETSEIETPPPPVCKGAVPSRARLANGVGGKSTTWRVGLSPHRSPTEPIQHRTKPARGSGNSNDRGLLFIHRLISAAETGEYTFGGTNHLDIQPLARFFVLNRNSPIGWRTAFMQRQKIPP